MTDIDYCRSCYEILSQEFNRNVYLKCGHSYHRYCFYHGMGCHICLMNTRKRRKKYLSNYIVSKCNNKNTILNFMRKINIEDGDYVII